MPENNTFEDQYDYEFQEGIDKSYFFETRNGYFYQINFKESNYLFSDFEEINTNLFEFVLDLIYPEKNSKIVLDNLIPATIAAIFRDFFSKNGHDSVIYIIDSSDSRQAARKRKFDNWVQLFKGDDFFKLDAEIIDNNKNKIFSSLIIKADNPHFNAIIKYFGSLSSENSK